MSPERASRLLREAGFDILPEAVEPRGDRWAVRLPGDRMAWFPASPAGRRRLVRERRVLDLVAKRCSFQTPRILRLFDGGGDIRALVPGAVSPFAVARHMREEPALLTRIGRWIGSALAEQHCRIARDDVTGWLPRKVDWPLPDRELQSRLAAVVTDKPLRRRIDQALARYWTEPVAAGDRVLVHTDIGLHNLAVDPACHSINGIFDYSSAAWADRHHDFRNLIVDDPTETLLDVALETYAAATGLTLSRDRIRRYGAACAIGDVADRYGRRPNEVAYDRTAAETLDWLVLMLDRGGL